VISKPKHSYVIEVYENYLAQLTSLQAITYGLICGLSSMTGYCSATNIYLGKKLGVSKQHIERILMKLEQNQFIKLETGDYEVGIGWDDWDGEHEDTSEFKRQLISDINRRIYPLIESEGKGIVVRPKHMQIEVEGKGINWTEVLLISYLTNMRENWMKVKKRNPYVYISTIKSMLNIRNTSDLRKTIQRMIDNKLLHQFVIDKRKLLFIPGMSSK
jgi:hypothetical protein